MPDSWRPDAKSTICLNSVIMKRLNAPLIDGGALSFKDEAKYFSNAETRLWECINKLRENGSKELIAISKIANSLKVSEDFVFCVLEESGIGLESGDDGD